MYTWGYLKDVTLAKLDLDEGEAEVQDLVRRFKFYANEAMTQICSTVKPKKAFHKIVVDDEDVGELIKMPADFISFNSDIPRVTFVDYTGKEISKTARDVDFLYSGYNEVICFTKGTFYIPYNARWITFTSATDDDTVIDIPADVFDCLPSYIAHQCYKIDDEYKASVYREEYELFLARIDITDFRQSNTLTIGGDW